MNATVSYEIGAVRGQVTIAYRESDSDEDIIAMAKQHVAASWRSANPWGMRTLQSWRVLSRGGQR